VDEYTKERFRPGPGFTRERRMPARPLPLLNGQTWQEWRERCRRAEQRLAEATRNGQADSWWEDDQDA
jgi:hypothetical protein